MVMMPDPWPSQVVRLVVHTVPDRRGGSLFVVSTKAGRSICTSRNPIACAAAKLLGDGYDASTTRLIFRDIETGIEESMTLSEAAEWQMHGLGDVVPIFGKAV